MAKIDDDFEACEIEAFWDGLEHHLKAMRSEMGRGPGWSGAELEDIDESLRWNDYMDFWSELDPTGSGFKSRRREGA